MPDLQVQNLGALNQYINPLTQKPGDLIFAQNVDSFPYGAKSKRIGYETFLGTVDGSSITRLFSWRKENGTTLFLYRASGTSLYYSAQGTGAWTACTTGGVTSTNFVDYAILGDTLMICDGAGSTRHTTNGTAFTNTSLAPVTTSLAEYQRRIYGAGTSSTMFYSTTNDATNWNTSGTSDSSSFTIPGAGKLGKVFKQNDRLIAPKTSGLMFKWDGFSLIDTATNLGPASPWSVSKSEDYSFWINRLGHYGYGGGKPQLLSNAVQRQFYNNAGSGVAGGTFDTMGAETHRFDYFMSLGTITDDLTNITINNAILKYDYQKNEYLNWKFAHFPRSWHSYQDANGVQQLIFGDNAGQVYKMSGTLMADAGSAIESMMIFYIDGGVPHLDKKWDNYWFFLNPGNQIKIQIALSDTYVHSRLKWTELGDASSGVLEGKFPQGSRSKFLFIKFYEASLSSSFNLYGFTIKGEAIEPL